MAGAPGGSPYPLLGIDTQVGVELGGSWGRLSFVPRELASGSKNKK